VSGRAVAEGRAVASSDVLSDPTLSFSDDVRDGLEVAADGAHLAVPLRQHDRVIGALLVADRAGRVFTDEETGLLQAFADQAALALENARLYARLEERAQKLTALSALTRLITSAQDTPHVFDAVARSATTLLGAHTARVWIDDPAAGGLTVAAAFGSHREVSRGAGEHAVMPYGVGLVGLVFASRRPEYVADVSEDPRWVSRRLAGESGARGFAGLPLVAGDRAVGVLSIFFAGTRAFTPEDKELIGFLADQAAIAIANARLYEGQQARAVRLRALANVTRIVSSSLDTGEVLKTIARAAADLMAVPLVAIWTADEGSQMLRIRAFSDETLGADFPVTHQRYDEGGAGWVAVHRAPLDVADVFADEHVVARAWFAAHHLRSAFVVPIVFGDALLGVLALFGRTPLRLGPDDRDLLEAFVAQAAVALRNARLYEELHVAHEQLERSQEQLIRSERLSALGEMAAGVAHDFNNLLAVILGRAELLLRRVDDPTLHGWVEAVCQAARDGADTVRRIQEFTRTRTTRALGRVELGDVLQQVVELTRPRWKDEAQSLGIQYDVRVLGQAPPVAGRPEELREVFANLLGNALDAMPEGGRCLLRLSSAAGTVEVAVMDTGTGMSDEVRQRVFEPFFTTKGQRGNGLGLAVAWGIVARHGGTIDVDSTPGAGTTFTVRLPAGHDFAAESAADAAVEQPPRRARILVVDDEPAVRLVLAALLKDDGHEVTQAASGQEALERCARERFDLVLSDLSMPRMSGWEFATACRERFPTLPVALITGWGDRLDPALLERHGVRFVLAKPFEAKEVSRLIAQVLP
jgi:GAF domain-containing protein/CheY-like chemotaxis protein